MTDSSTSKNGNEEIDLPQLMEKIRERAQERRPNSLIDTGAILSRVLRSDFAEASPHIPGLTLPELTLQPRFVPRANYHAKDFLDYDDQTFIRNAYLGILKREPDDAGYAQYLNALRQGRLDKVDILSRLRFSPEGRSQAVTVQGLKSAAGWRKLYRVPVIGYLMEWVAGILTLPVARANHRKLEAHVGAQNESLLEYINQTSLRLTWHIDEIAELNLHQNQALFREQRELTEDLNRLKREISNSVAETQNQFKQHAFTDEIQLEKLQELQELVTNEVVQKLQRTRMELVLQQRRVTMLLEEIRGAQPSAFDDERQKQSSDEKAHVLDSLYSALEDQFRGTRADIQAAFRVYLPILSKANVTSEIVDVGCGRGEWLEVLKEAGLAARGIDINRLAIQECLQLGLEVTEADAITYLKSLPDRSVNCITAFHVVEHLSLETLVKFIDECLRTLKSGGLLIMETPNPENVIVGSCNFYFDPTHRNPLPNQVMRFLLESRGFVRVEVLKLNPSDDRSEERRVGKECRSRWSPYH